MRAVYFTEHGGPEVLTVGELPDPEPGPGEVRIRVRASALNHLDLFVRRGIPGVNLDLPHVGGSDVAGEIESLGAGVDGWAIGDRVLVNPAIDESPLVDEYHIIGEHVWGGNAELVVAPAGNLHRIGDDVSFTDAAAVPLTLQTAWRALFTRARLSIGERLLVLGASGGVAVMAIQLAKRTGAFVYAVTSGAEKVRLAKDLGADVVIDRKEEDFSKVIWKHTNREGVHVVMENVGPATWESSLRCLGRGGRLVTFGSTTGPVVEMNVPLLFWKQFEIYGSTMATHDEFRDAIALFDRGEVKPVVHTVMPLDELRAAHEMLEAGRQFGKIVVEP